MATLLSRLLTAIAPVPMAEAKAATGPGVWSMSNLQPVTSLSDHPSRLMAEAEALFHTNGWVAQAERAISGRYVKAPWHIEDGKGETINPATATGPALVAHNLIAHPSKLRARRGLWSLTLRHMGLPGNAFWYLDQRDLFNGIPLELLYINPVRMTPVEDPAKNLLGWLMDGPDNPVTGKPGQPGVPFILDELRHFILDEPDSGHYGIGIAEAAASKVILDKLADRHAAQVLDSGGRIAGLLAPKTGATMNDDDWQAMVRDYRNIVGDPDSAKRLHIVKGPVDFTETAANPTEMQLADLMRLSREDIFGLWGVPLSQVGIMGTSGLNSGEHVKYEEAALWQGAIEFRAQPFEEQVQSILDLFKPLGVDLTLVVDKPAFDDEQPLYVNAEKAKVVPLTVDERRALVGLDPLDDKEVGAAIFLDQSMVQINAITTPDEQEEEPIVEAKAALPDDLARLRKRVEREFTPQLRQSLEAVFVQMGKDIRRKVVRLADHLATNPSDETVWWDEERWTRRFMDTLQPALQGLVRTTGRNTAQRLSPAKAGEDDYLDRVLEYVRLKGGDRIRGMLRTTRDSISKVIVDGVREGLSPADLGNRIEAAAGLDEYRAELISRTETMYAYNDAALGTYREFAVERVQAIDGDGDAECAARNGNIYSLDEASGITDHPNGTLDWVPIVEPAAKADPMMVMAESVKAVLERPLPTPMVNYHAAPITVEAARAPDVHVYPANAPVVNVHPAPVTVNMPKPGPRKVIRDAKGSITGIEES